MPELPEVEQIRRTLQRTICGAVVQRVRVHRADVFRRAVDGPGRNGLSRRPSSKALLHGSTIVDLKRHGKQLAIISDNGAVLCVHLGMSGQLRFVHDGGVLAQSNHVHCQWHLRMTGDTGRLIFRDPRRFGGVWLARSVAELEQHCWGVLGPDALAITPEALHAALKRTQRSTKAALLDQRLIAGVGNIYADEAMFDAAINPKARASQLSASRVERLHRALQNILQDAIASGGSTLRDYVDSTGTPGSFAMKHKVYGRAGCACTRCGGKLVQIEVAQRTTVYCGCCQRR